MVDYIMESGLHGFEDESTTTTLATTTMTTTTAGNIFVDADILSTAQQVLKNNFGSTRSISIDFVKQMSTSELSSRFFDRLKFWDSGFDLGFDRGFDFGFGLGCDLGFDLGLGLGFDLGSDLGFDLGFNVRFEFVLHYESNSISDNLFLG